MQAGAKKLDMYIILILIAVLIFAPKLSAWYNLYLTRRSQIAEMQAISLHRAPILIMSRWIGDTGVEDDASYVRQLLTAAKHPLLTSADVHVAIYNPSPTDGYIAVDFETWRLHIQAEHYKRCEAWKIAKMSETNVSGGIKHKMSQTGKDYLNNQRPRSRSFEWKE